MSFHASCVVFQNQAILFLGPSGAGKTTTAKHADGEIFKFWFEDNGAIQKNGSMAWVIDRIAKSEKELSILFGCVVVKDDVVKLEETTKLDQVTYLSRSLFELNKNRTLPVDTRKSMFLHMAKIANCFPLFRMHLPNDNSFIPVLYKTAESLNLQSHT